MTKLLSFQAPPLREMLLDVHFDRVADLRAPQLGLLWGQLRDELPHVEVQEPIDPEIERLDGVLPQAVLNLEMSRLGPPLRYWMLDERREIVLQVQPDRIIQNWRKVSPDSKYPRYQPLRDRFFTYLSALRELAKNDLGEEIVPVQCEVTYLNHIDGALKWLRDVRMLDGLGLPLDDLPNVEISSEDISFSQRFLLREPGGSPVARAVVEVQPAPGGAWVLKLTVRGKPENPDDEGVGKILDLGRQWINTSFARLTSETAKDAWGMEH